MIRVEPTEKHDVINMMLGPGQTAERRETLRANATLLQVINTVLSAQLRLELRSKFVL